jgi:2-oxoglutarate dehydrogenase E2 component (dihydrolipoamide succinyltransferase)
VSNIVVPEVGESIVEARVARWMKQAGDAVALGEPVVELETDKVNLEVPAPSAGVLSHIAHEAGADVKIGELLGVIDERATAAPSQGVPEEQAAAAAAPAAAASVDSDRTRATPTARKAAEQNEVKLSTVRGTGIGGRVTRKDVEQAAGPASADEGMRGTPVLPAAHETARLKPGPATEPVRPPAPRPSGERTEERVRMSKRRATIARRLVEAQSTAAMLTTFNEIDMSGVTTLRERRKQAFKERHGVSLGLSSFFVKAAIGALKELPRVNAEIQGDEIVLKHYYDIGIAVGAAEGLVVPVLRDADRLSFSEIEQQVRYFAKAAEQGTLSLADLKGGTFTITNGGVFGSLMSTPILNPPQVGILGLHAIKDRPVAADGRVEIRPMMYVALTYDHRLIDGSEAVRFLVKVKELIEDPGALLID